jgi:rSAM/selenodomain-associated transferase 2/rSAM/selenodomain-associated transferase 1
MRGLSIVVPVLDEGETLAARLHALAPLQARGARVVVADGGSTDATWAIARALADAVVLAPRGRAAQMNAGAAVAGGEVLLFLHADTRLPDDAVQAIATALEGGAEWGRFDVTIEGRPRMLRVVAALMNQRSRLTGIATGDQAIFVRRAVFEAEGGFPQQPLMEDIALCARLRRRSRPACLRQRVRTSGRRWERHGVWRTIALMWRLRAAYALGADPATLARAYGYRDAPPAPPPADIAILAKAPVPGFAKTRLVPALGAAGAARLQRRFLHEALAGALAAGPGAVTLWCAPDASHRAFRAVAQRCGVRCVAQAEGDLGARLAAVAATRRVGRPLLIMGTDCPLLGPGLLQAAARALQDADAVLLPAEDGGYALIGLARDIPGLFDGIAWSTGAVAEQTRERLAAAGARWHELPAVWDVDEPADWHRLQALTAPPP